MKLLLLSLLTLVLFAQAVPVTLADKTGDGAAHRLSSTVISARTVTLTALPTNTDLCRIGDASTSSTRGQLVAAGGSYHYVMPQLTGYSSKNGLFDLNQIYYMCASGDKLAVQYVP